MIVLLPPSESKSNRLRGRPADPTTWSFPDLIHARAEVAAALAAASARPDALEVLGVSAGLADEVARNLLLDSAPATPAAEVYTGVLYDALGLATLDAASLRRARRMLVVVSALHGAVRLGDRITAYRLSAGTDLPGIGRPETWWGRHLSPVLTAHAGAGVVVDCRSGSYLPMWRPSGAVATRWVQVRVPGASHMAKHTRGLVARALVQLPSTPRTVPATATALAETFEVSLREPDRLGRPWVLEVTST